MKEREEKKTQKKALSVLPQLEMEKAFIR